MSLATVESKGDWYERLVLDIKKMEFTGIVITKWNQGKRILQDELRFDRAEYGMKTIANLAKALETSTRELHYCIQFARKYELCDQVAQFEGKSWKYVEHELLPEHRRPGETPILPEGKYRTLVIDPPWPMDKILREVRPNQQKSLDYPTLTLDQIKALDIGKLAFDEGAHVYLWTTMRFLPAAFDLFEAWNIAYECELVWAKNVGFTPYSFMYDHESVLFGRIGNLDLLKKGERTVFQAKVREHSRKPAEFYDLVRRVSPEPRLDMFSREPHEGFEQWGNEPSLFAEATA
jgi:N6-adenosine-specific RNA methylase IME4